MELREAAQMVLKALEYYQHRNLEWDYADEHAIEALRAALATEPPCATGAQCVGNKCERCAVQPEQEPVAWMYNGNLHIFDPSDWADGTVTPLYNSPPQREWAGLTDEERQECLFSDPIFGMAASSLVRVIEAKLKEKNGG